MRIRIRPIYRLTRAITAFFGPVLLGPRDICNYPEGSKEVLSGKEDEVVEVMFPKRFKTRCRKAWYELRRRLILAEAVPGPELAKELMPYLRGRDPNSVFPRRIGKEELRLMEEAVRRDPRSLPKHIRDSFPG